MKSMTSICNKALLVAAMATLTAPAALAGDPPPQYAASCGACHAVGVAGAPATGNADAWAPRLEKGMDCLLYTSPSPRDLSTSRMPSSA